MQHEECKNTWSLKNEQTRHMDSMKLWSLVIQKQAVGPSMTLCRQPEYFCCISTTQPWDLCDIFMEKFNDT